MTTLTAELPEIFEIETSAPRNWVEADSNESCERERIETYVAGMLSGQYNQAFKYPYGNSFFLRSIENEGWEILLCVDQLMRCEREWQLNQDKSHKLFQIGCEEIHGRDLYAPLYDLDRVATCSKYSSKSGSPVYHLGNILRGFLVKCESELPQYRPFIIKYDPYASKFSQHDLESNV